MFRGREKAIKTANDVMLRIKMNLYAHCYSQLVRYSQRELYYNFAANRCQVTCVTIVKLSQYVTADVFVVLEQYNNYKNLSIDCSLIYVLLFAFHVSVKHVDSWKYLEQFVVVVAVVVVVIDVVAGAKRGVCAYLTGSSRSTRSTRLTRSTRSTPRTTPQGFLTTPTCEEVEIDKERREDHCANETCYRRYYRRYLICLTFNKIVDLYCDNVTIHDRIAVHKGDELYAPPAKPEEHSVFKLSNHSQGGTIRSIHQNLNHLGKSKSKCRFKNNRNVSDNVRYQCKSINKARFFLDSWHVLTLCRIELLHDIEPNPGPASVVKIISLNCRGLGNVDKCRQLLNRLYSLAVKSPLVVLLQETMIQSDNYIALAWRGRYVFTPGSGHGRGCITLMSHALDISDVVHYENRGHHFIMTDAQCEKILVSNIYAPNGYDEDKLEFFHSAFQHIGQWDGNIIVGGDFNLTLYEADRHCRGVTQAELRIGDVVKNYISDLDLTDCWLGNSGYTWRRHKTMSKLDHIYTRLDSYSCTQLTTNWTFTQSDHACVIAVMVHQQKVTRRNDHVKLDNSVVTNPASLAELREYLAEQIGLAENLNPHMKLDFIKMTIRTKALEIMARKKRKENDQL
jgi:hypothetical protein